jgi:hypothetical protein
MELAAVYHSPNQGTNCLDILVHLNENVEVHCLSCTWRDAHPHRIHLLTAGPVFLFV